MKNFSKKRRKEKSIFGRKIFSKEEENSLILFTAGMVFGVAMSDFAVGGYTFANIMLIILLLILLFVDRRIQRQ